MKPEQFIKKYNSFAFEAEKITEVPGEAQLAQGAFESGWGRYAIGCNLFGIKYRKGDWGFQRVLTTEYSHKPDAFPEKDIVTMDFIPSLNKYKYKVYQLFADYPSPLEAFLAHSRLLLTSRYIDALRWKDDPKRYLIAIWRAGYATDPNYGHNISKVVDSIERRLPREEDREKQYIRETIEKLEIIKSIEPKLFTVPKKVNLEENKLLNRL